MITLELVVGLVICCAGLLYTRHYWLVTKFESTHASNNVGSDAAVANNLTAHASPLEQWLGTLNIQMGATWFFIGLLMLASCVFMLVFTLLPEQWLYATAGAAMMILFSLYLLSEMAAARVRRFDKGLVTALDLMRASLVGGLAPRQAIMAAAIASKGLVKTELLELVHRLELGSTVEHAVARLLSRYNSEGSRLFAQAVIARFRSGGDFASMLSAVSQLQYDRINQRLTMEGQLSATRYAAIFAGVLPYLLTPLLLWKHPEWFEPLKQHPLGPTWLGIALLIQIVGYLWLRKALRIRQ